MRRFIPENCAVLSRFFICMVVDWFITLRGIQRLLSTLAHISGREIRAFDYPKAPETPMAELVGHLEQQLSTELNHVDAAPCLMGDSVGGLLRLVCWFSVQSGFFPDSSVGCRILRWFAEHWFPWCRQQQFDPLASDYAFSKLPPWCCTPPNMMC